MVYRTFRTSMYLLLLFLVSAPTSSAGAQRESQPQLQKPWMSRAPEYPAGRLSRYYNIKSDLEAEELKELASHLDRTFEAYRERLSMMRQNIPVTFNVLIFKDPSDYQLTLSMNYGVNAQGSAGMFFSSPRGSALAFFTGGQSKQRVTHVLQHEGFHQFAAALFAGRLPPWVNEGLAEFFGEAIMVDGKLVIGQTNPRVIENIKQSIEAGTHIPFLQMLNMDGSTWNAAVQSGQAGLQYDQAWSMVHFLIYGEEGKYVEHFVAYLRFMNAGMKSYDAFVRAFNTDDVNLFEHRWKQFAQNARPSSFVTAMERIEFLAAGLLELSKRKTYPSSIDELKEKLVEINFEYSLDGHGQKIVLKASDSSLYLIPRDDLIAEDDESPTFALEEPSLRGMRVKERNLNATNPLPPMVRTYYLEPRNIAVLWIRDMETNTFTFDIVASGR